MMLAKSGSEGGLRNSDGSRAKLRNAKSTLTAKSRLAPVAEEPTTTPRAKDGTAKYGPDAPVPTLEEAQEQRGMAALSRSLAANRARANDLSATRKTGPGGGGDRLGGSLGASQRSLGETRGSTDSPLGRTQDSALGRTQDSQASLGATTKTLSASTKQQMFSQTLAKDGFFGEILRLRIFDKSDKSRNGEEIIFNPEKMAATQDGGGAAAAGAVTNGAAQTNGQTNGQATAATGAALFVLPKTVASTSERDGNRLRTFMTREKVVIRFLSLVGRSRSSGGVRGGVLLGGRMPALPATAYEPVPDSGRKSVRSSLKAVTPRTPRETPREKEEKRVSVVAGLEESAPSVREAEEPSTPPASPRTPREPEAVPITAPAAEVDVAVVEEVVVEEEVPAVEEAAPVEEAVVEEPSPPVEEAPAVVPAPADEPAPPASPPPYVGKDPLEIEAEELAKKRIEEGGSIEDSISVATVEVHVEGDPPPK